MLSPVEVNELEEAEWFTLTHPNGRQIYVSGKDAYDYACQFHTQICYERWDGPTGELVRPPWKLKLRFSFPQEIETLLHYNGFRIVAKYAEYDGTPVSRAGGRKKPGQQPSIPGCPGKHGALVRVRHLTGEFS